MQLVYGWTTGSLKAPLGQQPRCHTAVQVGRVPQGLSKLKRFRLRVASCSDITLVDRPPKHEHHKKLKVLPRVQYR